MREKKKAKHEICLKCCASGLRSCVSYLRNYFNLVMCLLKDTQKPRCNQNRRCFVLLQLTSSEVNDFVCFAFKQKKIVLFLNTVHVTLGEFAKTLKISDTPFPLASFNQNIWHMQLGSRKEPCCHYGDNKFSHPHNFTFRPLF